VHISCVCDMLLWYHDYDSLWSGFISTRVRLWCVTWFVDSETRSTASSDFFRWDATRVTCQQANITKHHHQVLFFLWGHCHKNHQGKVHKVHSCLKYCSASIHGRSKKNDCQVAKRKGFAIGLTSGSLGSAMIGCAANLLFRWLEISVPWSFLIYHLVIWHSHGKSPFLIGK
jgi:hypothetical protein